MTSHSPESFDPYGRPVGLTCEACGAELDYDGPADDEGTPSFIDSNGSSECPGDVTSSFQGWTVEEIGGYLA